MAYSQLIQFKRLEERAFIFLNGRQMMFAVFGGFSGLSLANALDLSGWLVWIAVIAVTILGVVIGARFRGLYGYQYLALLARSVAQLNNTVEPAELYDRPVDADLSYVLGAPDGGALVLRQAPPASERQVATSYEAAIYRLKPVDLAQYHPQAVQQLMQRWSGFWSGARAPTRFLIHSTPFYADQVVEDVRAAGLVAREDWRSRALAGYGRFLEALTREAAMYQATHEMIVWANSDTEAQATVGSLASWLGVSARPAEMTPLLDGEYQLMLDHLAPLDPRQPYIVLLVSHEFSGEWSWADPLVTLLRQTFAVSVVVDVERNLSANEALRELVKYENVLTDVLANARSRDPKAEGAMRDVQLAMAKANGGLALHFTTVVVAVKGATLAEVKQNVEAVRTLTAARLSLVVLPGGQGELLKFFTTTRRREINIPEISHNVTSDGMAVISGPLGFRRRSETDGIFWGIGSSGGSDTYPIWWNGFGRDPDKPAAYHGMFLGKSGYGKTVSMNALLYREAMRATQVVMMEPQGHSKKLVQLVGEDGASYNALSMAEMQVNPLDPIYDDLNDQKSYLTSLCRLMLKQVDPERNLSIRESGLLDAALAVLYDGLSDPLNTPARYVPRLEQLCQELHRQGAQELAGDLELNYVYGTLGQVYNQATNTDVALEANVVTYDFKDIPESQRTLIYTLVLGRIQRIVRSQGRRRRVVAIDEFGWMAQEPILANVVAMWIKTFRTFGCGIWLAEQDLIRLTGGAASGDLSGHSIVGNSVFQLFFHHESAAANMVSETFPNMEPYQNMLESFPRPQETGLAEAVLRIPGGAYHMYMLLSDIERSLIGS
jgi:hypothetical protein